MRTRIAIAVGLALLAPTIAWAYGSDHPPQPVGNSKWPQGLAALANAENRVHGYFVNHRLQLTGDARDG